MMDKERTVGIFSFFAGLGALDLGFEDSKSMEVLFVNEYHHPFVEAYKHARQKLSINPPVYGYSTQSIEDFLKPKHLSSLKDLYVNAKNRYDNIGFIGGPPCPDFSVGGKNMGQDGQNGKLSKVYINLIAKIEPDFFLFENVKGLWRTKRHRAFYEKLKQQLSEKYDMHERLVNAIQFGVPQDRDRIILLGFNKKKFNKGMPDWDAILKYETSILKDSGWPLVSPFKENSRSREPHLIDPELTVEYWFKKNAVNNHPNSKHHFTPRAALQKFKVISEGDVSKKSFKRLHRWRYSPTAAYGNNEVHLHPYHARRISAAEALAIQSLPKEFELPNTMSLTDMFKSIGNGVPFLMAKGLANLISIYLERNIIATKPTINATVNRQQHSPRNKPIAERPILSLY